jgi:hypothetical protein
MISVLTFSRPEKQNEISDQNLPRRHIRHVPEEPNPNRVWRTPVNRHNEEHIPCRPSQRKDYERGDRSERIG